MITADTSLGRKDERQSISLSQDLVETAQGKRWAKTTTSLNAATTRLLNVPRYIVQIADDEVAEINVDLMNQFSREKFAAVVEAPAQAPSVFDEAKKARFALLEGVLTPSVSSS